MRRRQSRRSSGRNYAAFAGGNSYDAASRWTSLTSPTGATWSRTYDALDRVTTVTVRAPLEVTGRTTSYGYDEAGNVTRIEDPFGGVTTQEYDAVGQLIELSACCRTA